MGNLAVDGTDTLLKTGIGPTINRGIEISLEQGRVRIKKENRKKNTDHPAQYVSVSNVCSLYRRARDELREHLVCAFAGQ